jgi:multiple sugar transport system substrate-binding protein
MKPGKWLQTTMVLTLAAVMLLAGCGSNSNEEGSGGTTTSAAETAETNSGPVEITYWNLFGGGEGDFADQIVKNFNDSQSEIVVKALRLESNEYYAKLGTALASGKGPDVAIAHVDKIAPFVKANQLAALDEPAAKAGFDYADVTDSNAQSVVYDGKHYAVPIDTHFHMLYYNKDLLDKAGLLTADGLPNLGDVSPEGFKNFLTELKNKLPDIEPFAVNVPYFHEPFYNLYYEAGGDLLNADNTQAAINNDKALQVLNFYLDLFDSKLSDVNDKTPWQTFHDGKAALWFGGVWEAGWHFGEQNLNVGAMPLPPIFGSEQHWGSSHTLVVPAYVDPAKQEAALKFAKYYILEGGKIWGQAGHVPAGKAVVSSDEYKNLPYRKYFIEAQKTVKFAPKTDKYNAIDTSIQEVLQNIVFKKVTPQEGLGIMEKEINDILAN